MATNYSDRDWRDERRRRWLYLFFGACMITSALIIGAILFAVLRGGEQRRLVGQEAEFAVLDVTEVPVERLDLTTLLPNRPSWSQDIVFVVKREDNTIRAFLGLDPLSGCKLNWRENAFVDDCSGAKYSVNGQNADNATTLSGPANANQAQRMIEMPVQIQEGDVYIVDRILRRDQR
jgi:hypothetical protein